MERHWRYRLDEDLLVVETRVDPGSRRFIINLNSAHDRFSQEWVDSTQFDAHVRALRQQLAEDGWHLA